MLAAAQNMVLEPNNDGGRNEGDTLKSQVCDDGLDKTSGSGQAWTDSRNSLDWNQQNLQKREVKDEA